MRAYEGYACKSLLPTNGEGGKSLEEENILSETGINGPAFSPFIMKGSFYEYSFDQKERKSMLHTRTIREAAAWFKSQDPQTCLTETAIRTLL